MSSYFGGGLDEIGVHSTCSSVDISIMNSGCSYAFFAFIFSISVYFQNHSNKDLLHITSFWDLEPVFPFKNHLSAMFSVFFEPCDLTQLK